MKPTKIVILGLSALIVLGAIGFYCLNHHCAMLKAVLGRGRILVRRSDAQVYVGSAPLTGAMCFGEAPASGNRRGRLVLWMPDPSASDGHEVYVIDRDNHDVGQPNSSDDDYHLYLGTYLAQSDSGYATILVTNGVKSYGADPHLEITSAAISFTMPSRSTYMPNGKVEVRWDPDAQSMSTRRIAALVASVAAVAVAFGWVLRARRRQKTPSLDVP